MATSKRKPAKKIAKKVKSLDALIGLTKEQLLETDEVGGVIAESIADFFAFLEEAVLEEDCLFATEFKIVVGLTDHI